MRLVAKKSFNYGGRRLSVAEEFDATSSHARVLCAINRAEPAAPLPSAPAIELQPEPEPEPKPRRQYRRRDMQAET